MREKKKNHVGLVFIAAAIAIFTILNLVLLVPRFEAFYSAMLPIHALPKVTIVTIEVSRWVNFAYGIPILFIVLLGIAIGVARRSSKLTASVAYGVFAALLAFNAMSAVGMAVPLQAIIMDPVFVQP